MSALMTAVLLPMNTHTVHALALTCSTPEITKKGVTDKKNRMGSKSSRDKEKQETNLA
jgi:hypothetical protein